MTSGGQTVSIKTKQGSLLQVQAKAAYKTDVWGLIPYAGLGLYQGFLSRVFSNPNTEKTLKSDDAGLNLMLGVTKKLMINGLHAWI